MSEWDGDDDDDVRGFSLRAYQTFSYLSIKKKKIEYTMHIESLQTMLYTRIIMIARNPTTELAVIALILILEGLLYWALIHVK